MPDPTATREAQAAREVGHTDVSRGVALGLTGVFLLLVLAVSASEVLRDARRASGSPWSELAAAPGRARQALRASGLMAANRQLLSGMTAFEDALEDGSAVTARVLPPVQQFLTRRLGAGNEQVVVGRKGWLYFRQAVDHLTGPGFLDPGRLTRAAAGGQTWRPAPRPDPVPAIADFAAQLAARGIGLVVVVTPVKAAVHPEKLAPELGDAAPLENASFGAFVDRLGALEVPVYAPGAGLAKALQARSWPQFLRTDSHWTPAGMENAARGLAEFLRRHVALPERNAVRYGRREVWTEGNGDLKALLRLPAKQKVFPPEPVLTRPVSHPSGEPWRPDPDADILVLGDRFTNIYSQAELMWGEGAGFAEQLSYFLQRPVDRLAINAGGPSAARERLALQIAAGDDRLAGKRLLVYQVSARELSWGDWRVVDLSGAGSAAVRRGPGQGVPARGFVAWESRRGGDWRIWSRRLEGSAPRQLSPDEPDRQHCCTHVSPDGSQLVYLSRDVPRDEYPQLEVPGELRLLRLDGGGERTLVADARPYGWGNRAVVWRNDHELVYIGADGRTWQLDVGSGQATLLLRERQRKLAWLVDATLRRGVKGAAAFSAYDHEARRVVEGERFPGCEPYFSHDGRFGFWVRGGGGPFHWIDLRSRETGVLLEKDDPRIADDQRYAYFPMLSRSGEMLAFGASPGDHDHAFSNYDIFVAPVDPATLALQGRPLRLTLHPAGDRYPDVHVESLDRARWEREAPPVAVAPARKAPAAAGKPFAARLTLGACSRAPSLREISPYRAALIVCEWTLDEVLAGEPAGPRLRIAHWALRDGQRQPVASLAPGAPARLQVQPLASVETEGYPLFDTLKSAPELPVHFADGP